MSQQFNISPDNLRMAVDYIAGFEIVANRTLLSQTGPASFYDPEAASGKLVVTPSCGPMNRLRFILPSMHSDEFVSVSKLCFRHQIACSTISSQQARS
jgi:hypothetical protein